jgi:hypothetical protein
MTSMPEPGEDDQNSNHTEDIILGVDTQGICTWPR